MRSSKKESIERFELINFENLVIKTGGRGVACVFDVKLQGLTICNLTLEYNTRGEFVLGYPPSPIRKRVLKARQQIRLGLTPEFEKSIFEEANYMLGATTRKLLRESSFQSEYFSPVDGLTLPNGPDDEPEEADDVS